MAVRIFTQSVVELPNFGKNFCKHCCSSFLVFLKSWQELPYVSYRLKLNYISARTVKPYGIEK